jgi:arabinan endo-1,5-alpha-L-arabinosidase
VGALLLAAASAACIPPANPPIVTTELGPAIVPVTGDTAGIHDPAIAKQGNTYYLFSTGRGIHVRTSTDLVHWSAARDVFARIPSWVQQRFPDLVDLWAPDVSWWNGQWHLYYSASEFATRNSAIGLATTPTLDPSAPEHGWVDHGPVVSSKGTFADPDLSGGNAIDPNVVQDGGQRWLAWGSAFGGLFQQPLAPDGKLARGSSATHLAARDQPWKVIEAAWIVRRGSWWYLFASYDFCCNGSASNYNIRVGRSQSLTGPFLDRDGRPLLEGGGTPVLRGYGSVRGPGHQGVLHEGVNWWLYHHYYDASRGGVSDLSLRPLDWIDGWPVARGWSPAIPTPNPPFP